MNQSSDGHFCMSFCLIAIDSKIQFDSHINGKFENMEINYA